MNEKLTGATELERFKNESKKCLRCMEMYLEDYAEDDGTIPHDVFETAVEGLVRDLRFGYSLSKMAENTVVEVEE